MSKNWHSFTDDKIWVKTLDLNLPFSDIAVQLNKIADEYFMISNEYEVKD